MSPGDPFSEGREQTEELRRALESVREDARALVRKEVAEAGLPESELKRMVAELVREEMAAARAASRGRPARWPAPVVLVAGVTVGLLAGAVGYRVLAGSPGADAPEQGVVESGVETPAGADGVTGEGGPGGGAAAGARDDPPADGSPSGAAASGGATAEERAARYDSLFAAGAPELDALAVDLEGAAAAPVLEALATWRVGGALGAGPRRRLHDALVQAAVNRLAGADLALDGLVTREPCRGASCGAVLRLWEGRGAEWGLPSHPVEAEARERGLPVVERILVLEALEAGRG